MNADVALAGVYNRPPRRPRPPSLLQILCFATMTVAIVLMVVAIAKSVG